MVGNQFDDSRKVMGYLSEMYFGNALKEKLPHNKSSVRSVPSFKTISYIPTVGPKKGVPPNSKHLNICLDLS